MALGDKTEFAVIARGPFILGWNGGFANPAGTLTEPHEGNPFGAGETRLDEMSTFFVRFRTEFLSTDFPESRVIGGFPEFATCGLGTLNSALLEPSLDVSIVLRLGMPRFDRAIRPPSLAFLSFPKQGSHTRYGLLGLGASAALRAFFELHPWQYARPQL
jgi:hypothetical protein